MDLNKYYQEHKDNINSLIMEIASDLAEGNLIQEFKLPFEALVEPEDSNNPDNECIRYKEKYQDHFNQFYDIEYNRLAKLMNFDYDMENGQMSGPIESKATEIKTAYATVRYNIENITGAEVSDEDIDDVLGHIWNDTKIVGDYIISTEICGRMRIIKSYNRIIIALFSYEPWSRYGHMTTFLLN